MAKVKKVLNNQQQQQPLNEFNIKLDLKKELKNIINKNNQYVIPIFIPHMGCKNDCVFCNQVKITGLSTNVTVDEVKNIIEEHLKYFDTDNGRKIEIAFFGGSFTGIDLSKQIEYLEVANKYVIDGKVASIRLSTRPDYISIKILNVLSRYNVKTIELGVQSMNNDVLLASKRGHTKAEVLRAARLISLYNINLGIQIMVGLPKSTEDTEIYTIKEVLKLKPYCLRIYPVYVLKPSKLYDMYLNKEYVPLTIEEATKRTYLILKECMKTNVKVIRIGLQSTSEITSSNAEIVGPVCDNFAEYALSRIVLNSIEKKLEEMSINRENIAINLTVPSKYLSIAIGPKKINKLYFKEKYNIILKVKGE